MNSAKYAQILEEFCIPFIIRNNEHPSDMVLHQDNDTKHTSRECVRVIEANDLTWVITINNIN